MFRRYRASLLVAMAVLLVGCGSADTDTGGAEGEIRDAVEGFYTYWAAGDGTETCARLTEYVATRFAADQVSIAQDFGQLQNIALGALSCAEVVERLPAGDGRTFRVESIEVEDDQAAVTMQRSGTRIEVVHEDGRWRVADFGGPTGY